MSPPSSASPTRTSSARPANWHPLALGGLRSDFGRRPAQIQHGRVDRVVELPVEGGGSGFPTQGWGCARERPLKARPAVAGLARAREPVRPRGRAISAGASTMPLVRGLFAAASLAACFALLAAGCGGSNKAATSTPAAAPAARQRRPAPTRPAGAASPTRSSADVYCPGWLPDPLTSLIGGPSNNIDSVSRDRSYLESFIWQDTDSPALSGELHVILRGYPGRTAIPTCLEGLKDNVPTPCFAGRARNGDRERDQGASSTP